ncbi:outer membrane protein transport protein [Gammaproteobacteria bacterium AB-CW1]|uniref:Outer membrane protein transport protein n=1 Tax=Natronospira elongata TaxID=3110268 RepID=A0AAP6JCG6_9GAMM|nr:outer membrane protein transport protein [Gammaproteobacteria bacterium AB-CW1]
MSHSILRCCTAVLVVGATAAVPIAASAAGFAVTHQGARGAGHAFAGGAALAEDASTIFFNPAGMTRLEGREFVISLHGNDVRMDFTKDSATDAIGQPLSGGEGGRIGQLSFIPNAYYHQQINDQLHFGVGLSVPFGSRTKYDSDSIFRYQALESDLGIINLAPSIAYKVNDVVSLGLGLNIHYMEISTLSNALDFGAICFAQVDPTTCSAQGLSPQSADGRVELSGDGMGYGFTAGALFDWGETRLGVNYRSSVDHDLSGKARFSDVPTLFSTQGLFIDDRITSEFESPDALSLSIAHQVSDQITLFGDYTRMGWQSFDELRVEFDNPNQPDSVEPINFQSQDRYSIGLDYRRSDAWTFRAGIAYDESAARDRFNRPPRTPDNDRTWLALGATWQTSESSEWDFAYVHVMLGDDTPFDRTGGQGDRIVGSYEAAANILSAQYRYRF